MPLLTESLFRVIELTGVFAFAISGALLGVRKAFDIVGLTVLALATALGGGILRDLVIGDTPPVAFTDLAYLVVPLVAAVLVLFWHPVLERVTPLVLLFDAAGLALFCVTGATKALDHGLGPVQAVMLGVTTAVGGGIIRDLLAGEVPTVCRHGAELYAVAALLGAAVAVLADALGQLNSVTAVAAAVLAFALRVLAMRYGWLAPAPRPPRQAT